MRLIFAGALAAVLMAAAPALAAQQDFTLENSTGYTIQQVFVSATTTNSWEEDVLGKDVLEDGDSVEITFSPREGACRFDLKVVYDDGEDAIWEDLNLCSISNVEIHYNRRTGETSASVD